MNGSPITRPVLSTLALVALVGCSPPPARSTSRTAAPARREAASQRSDPVWGDSYEKAIQRARSEKRFVLADFTGSDWCGWCIRLKKEVFDMQGFKDWAAGNVVLLEVDFPRGKEQSEALKAQNARLSDKYGIESFPTILFLDAEGRKVGELGYVRGGPSAWIAEAQRVLGVAR